MTVLPRLDRNITHVPHGQFSMRMMDTAVSRIWSLDSGDVRELMRLVSA